MDYRILGSIEVLDQGRLLALGGAKQRALLAILLLHSNQTVSTDGLIDDLWGEEPPPTAENALQVYISQLRKSLRGGRPKGAIADPLLTKPPGYQLQVDADELDLLRFERLSGEGRQALADGNSATAFVKLSEALALWRGPPLHDFRFEPFAQDAIERLEEVRLSAQENRIEVELELGRHDGSIAELESLVRANPLRERLREHLIVALYRSGRQAEAIEQFHQVRQVLAEDLGIDPGLRLQRLNELVLRQDPSLDVSSEPAAVPPISQAAVEVPAALAARPRDLEMVSPITGAVDKGNSDLRLPVTALCADLHGGVALGERLSPEEVRVVIEECLSRMSRAIERFGGTIDAYVGDGIRAYFGLLDTHEDDPQRASRAALRIVEIVTEQAREIREAWGIEDFGARVGVNSGRTVRVGGSENAQRVASGDPLDVAEQLMAAADLETVVVGGTVASRIRDRFILEPAGVLTVKRHQAPVEAWRLVGPIVTSEAVPITPLVGREGEMEIIRDVVRDLVAGRGRILLVQGEAGVGKSRMLAELKDLLPESVIWLRGDCHNYDVDVPLEPVAQIVRGWLGIGAGESQLSARTKLRARAGQSQEATPILSALAHVLSLELDPPLPISDGAPLASIIEKWLESVAAMDPTVLVVDDLHAADSSTIDVLEELLAVTDKKPILIVVASRHAPESEGWRFFVRAMGDFGHRVAEIRLSPLDDRSISHLADSLAGTGSLDESTSREIVMRAEGNPLFAEEFVKVMSGAGAFQRVDRWTLTMSASVLTIPPALEGVLLTRIQRLPAGARSIAQAASIIGREFPVSLVEELAAAEAGDLEVLLRAEIVREVQRFPEFICAFAHGLLQEAASSTLTPARVKEMHGRAAAAFEARGERGPSIQDERLAMHWYRSDQPGRSIAYLEKAADAALVSGDRRRAQALWERGIRAASRDGNDDAKSRLTALRDA